MDLSLGVNNSAKNKIGKSISDMITYSGTLRDETSIINPVVMLEAGDISGCNYAYIPQFQRYYFIKEISVVRAGLWRVELAVDVLESFKTQIKNLSVILKSTQATGATNYISGDVWRTNVKETTTIINFSDGLSASGEFILITAGG